MDDRKSKILQAIIEDYVATAEPVGSRTISRKFNLGVSPATIRNEMADLEDLGYLEQPHTSAGRVPSDRGYRYYVDCLMETREMGPEEEEIVRRTFKRKAHEIDTLIRETVRLLSERTHLTAVVSGPQLEKAHFRDIRLVPMGPDKAVLVYITDSGMVENQVLDLPMQVTMLEMQRVSDVLSDQLKGQPVETLSRNAVRVLQQELHKYGALLEHAIKFLEQNLEPGERQRLYLGGTMNMLDQPEFQSVDKMRNLLTLLEQENVVSGVLESTPTSSESASVQIGEEIRVRDLADCSLVSTTYRLGERVVGRMGIIGPKRMDYGRVVGVMNSITRHLSETINRSR